MAIASNGMRFSRLTPQDAAIQGAGNRFDVPGGGVLYCCTELEGCYRETLARMRVSPRMRELDEDNENQHMRAGCIPASWRDARRVFQFSLDSAAPFLDVEHQDTWTLLDSELRRHLSEPLDVAAVRGKDRLLTRAIAEWAYTQVDENGVGRYAGVRYVSRTGDYECWAVFEGAPITMSAPPEPIELGDSTLRTVARAFDLTLN
ncbi:RES family NAD+ phosphorylase [Cellulomonas sp. Y8]|uniref:RES family NAD+ phosphorylase n=1 Tax=Cellulomonas sp. Y8 TaxID=2591145 RepID=UPI003D71ED67